MSKILIKRIWGTLFLLPLVLTIIFGQTPTKPKSQSRDLVTFSPFEKKDKKRRTKFRKLYKGRINGQDRTLSFSEITDGAQIRLRIELGGWENGAIWVGETIIMSQTYQLNQVKLLDGQGKERYIRHLFLHRYNPNYLNLVTEENGVGYFALEDLETPNSEGEKRQNIENFAGFYNGRLNGLKATLDIQKLERGVQIVLRDIEQKQTYWTLLPALTKASSALNLSNILLQSTTSAKSIFLEELLLDAVNYQTISGMYTEKNQRNGLFFVKDYPPKRETMPIFPWPPPDASARVNVLEDDLASIKNLGQLNQLIIEKLQRAGSPMEVNRYFYLPNGFVLVTGLERIDESVQTSSQIERFRIALTNESVDFRLLDYLKSLVGVEEGIYRLSAFVVTDDLTPNIPRIPTSREKSLWKGNSFGTLPKRVGKIPLNRQHYCRLYVYEFEQKEGQIQAKLIRSNQRNYW
ncbi:MAG: hypothetical protein AAF960_29790 [Bacteroidota bacterium]